MLLYEALPLAVFIQVNLKCNTHWPAIIGFVSFDFLVKLVMGLALGYPILAVFIVAGLNLVFAYPFFFLLGRTQGTSHYWTILIFGVALFLSWGLFF